MKLIKQILENQKEVVHLGYFIVQDEKTSEISVEISASDIVKKYKFKNENTCLNKLIDILLELRKLERWSSLRQERNAKNKSHR